MELLTIIGMVSSAMSAGVLPDSLDAAVGGTVMFSTTLSPTETPLTVVWRSSGPIITSTPTANITAPKYGGSITLFRSTGSLELRDVHDDDIGKYRVTIVTTERKRLTGSTDLRVHVPITAAQLGLSSEDLLEFNSSVTFSCSVSSGSSLSFLWQNISSEISASDGVQITDGGAKLTVLNVTRYDQGPFRCSVFNPVSRGVTDPLTLSISYGPDDVDLQVSPSQEHFEEGSNIRLSCSSSSSPPARLQWFVNDTLLPNTGAELLVSSTQKGYYSCQAFNSKTLRYRSSRRTATVLLAASGPCFAGCLAAMAAVCSVIMAAAVGGVYLSKRRCWHNTTMTSVSFLDSRCAQEPSAPTTSPGLEVKDVSHYEQIQPQEEDYDQLRFYENTASLRST